MLGKLLNFFRARRLEEDIREEIAFHRAQSGGTFGNGGLVADGMRDASTFIWLEDAWRDARFAVRLLGRSPVFTLTAVVSLALGIGANTAIFSLADAVLLKQLPVEKPQQLRMLEWSSTPHFDMPFHSYDGECEPQHGRRVCGSFSYPFYQTIEKLPQFAGVVGFADWDLIMTASDRSEAATGHLISGNYFQVLGVKAFAGRMLAASDDKASQPLRAVVSHRYWTQHFAQDKSILERVVLLNQKPATIVGIAPAAFNGLNPGSEPDFYVPVAKAGEIGARNYLLDRPDHWWFRPFARLAPGVTNEQARDALNSAFLYQMHGYSGKDLRKDTRIELEAGGRGLNILRNSMSLEIYVLAAAVGLVLLIACANLANLLLARATARRREVALRLSIGASRGRLLRQLLTESLLLSAVGGAAGVLVAFALMRVLILKLAEDAALDGRALVFAMAASLVCGLLFSIAPAQRATKLELGTALKDGALAGSGASPRLRLSRLLVAGQVALSLVLLIGAGLFVRTLIALYRVPLGFRAENVLTFQTDASLSGLKDQKLADLYGQMRESIERVPGVVSVAMSRHGLIEGGTSSNGVGIPGRSPGQEDDTKLHFCSDSFLRTMQIPVLAGRDLKPSDRANAMRVAVVNKAFAKKYFPGLNPVGEHFLLGDTPRAQAEGKPILIVGLAGDAHYASVREAIQPTVYVPYAQHFDNLQQMTFLVRTALPPKSLEEPIRKAMAQVDRAVPLTYVHSELEVINRSLWTERLYAGLVSGLGLLAVLLAATGLYGVVYYAVARRTQEIGVRLALGATRADVLALVVRECVWLVGAGLAIGIPVAFAATRLLGKALYGVKADDAGTYTAAALSMIAVAVGAALIPARRAVRIEPITALKYE